VKITESSDCGKEVKMKNESAFASDPDTVKCIKACAIKTFERFGFGFGVEVEFSSGIPESLGNKCALINSTVLASLGLITKKYGRIQNACIFKDLRTDKFSKDKLMEIEGRIISDSEILRISKDVIKEQNLTSECPLEDLYASYYGGFFVADNKENKILRFGENENLRIMILESDKKTKKYSANKNTLKNETEIAFNEALKGNLYTSMNLNALICAGIYGGNFEAVKSALDAGALSCSLSGNSFSDVSVAVSRDNEVKEKIMECWGVFEGKLIESESNNEKAKLTEI
jgi:shikimate kinase